MLVPRTSQFSKNQRFFDESQKSEHVALSTISQISSKWLAIKRWCFCTIQDGSCIRQEHGRVIRIYAQTGGLGYSLTIGKLLFFCLGRIISYYSLGAETSGPRGICDFAPDAPVHAFRVS